MSFYRDALAGLKSQVAQKRGLLERRQGQLAPLLRAMLPGPLRGRLDDASRRVARAAAELEGGRVVEAGEALEALTEADAALDGLLTAYDEALALAPRLRECPLDVADPPKPRQRPPWLIEEERQRALRLRLEQRVREIAPEAYVVRWGDITYLTRLSVAGAPVRVVVRGNFDVNALTTETSTTVWTSVPDATPVVRVKPKGAIDGLATALRLARDDETGDAELDAAFMVDAKDAGVRLLTPDVTRAMRALAPWAPTLGVHDGIAEVSWAATFRNQTSDLVHDAAFAVVLGVRAAIERA